MNTNNYSSAWGYFYSTEANGEEDDITGQSTDAPANSAQLIEMFLGVHFTKSEWEQLKKEAESLKLTPEQFIKQKLFNPSK